MPTRLAGIDDLPALMRIEEQCFGAERFTPETIRAFLQREDTFVLIADEDTEWVGSAMCLFSESERHGKIASIAVIREFRGQGIGSALLRECEHCFKAKNLTKYSLEVETINEPAIALYTSKGYEIKGVLADFYGLGRDAYYMEKKSQIRGHSVRITPS